MKGWARVLDLLRRSFTRPGSSLEYIPQIDGLRALAVLLVLGHHVFATYLVDTHRYGTQRLPDDWNKIAPFDPMVWWGINLVVGVPIFCVISGFVLTIPFARNIFQGKPQPSIPLYFLRRLIRLEPPYVLSMLFGFALVVIHPFMPRWYFFVQFHTFWPHLLASLAYLHAIVFGTASWIAGISWTLEIEVQFYLMLPLLAQLFRLKNLWLRRGILLAAVIAAGLVLQLVLPRIHSDRLNLSVVDLLCYFLAGMLLADVYLAPPKWKVNRYLADAIAAACAGILIYVIHYRLDWTWAAPLVIATSFYMIFAGAFASRIFAWTPLTAIGAMSYTIYLYHLYVVEGVLHFSAHWIAPVHALWLDAGLEYLLALVPVLLVSAILYLAFERPFVTLSHQVSRRLRASRNARTVPV